MCIAYLTTPKFMQEYSAGVQSKNSETWTQPAVAALQMGRGCKGMPSIIGLRSAGPAEWTRISQLVVALFFARGQSWYGKICVISRGVSSFTHFPSVVANVVGTAKERWPGSRPRFGQTTVVNCVRSYSNMANQLPEAVRRSI